MVFVYSFQNINLFFNLQSYDFVFSVDVEDGKPPLKLPYNRGEDPYKAATAFLVRNNLPGGYLEQVCTIFCFSFVFF